MHLLTLFATTLTLLFAGYTPALAAWTDLPDMKKPRAEASATRYQGEVYVFNGFGPDIDIENSIEKYNPATSEWTLVGTTSVALGNAMTHNGLVRVGQDVWLIGGRIGDHPGKVSNKVWIFNLGSLQWRQGPKLPVPGAGGGAALVNNRIHWFGGLDPIARCDVNNHFVLNLANQSAGWQNITSTAAMPVPRNHFATTVLDDKIYAIGGQFGHDGCPGQRSQDTKFVHVFDTHTNKWSRLADLPTVQSHAEPSTLAHGRFIYSIGGETAGDKVLRFDPQTNKWTQILTLPQRLLAPIVWFENGRLVVAGGGAPNTRVPTTSVRSIDLGLPDFPDTSEPVDAPPQQTDTGELIVVEAEDYDLNIGTATHEWTRSTLAGASQSAAMITTPDNGSLRPNANGSPMLSYQVNFEHAGVYYLWIRGWGDTNLSGEGKSDSLHAGLDGVLAATADKIDGFPAGWHWSQSTRDTAVATLNVPRAGLQTVDFWMREDGLAMDKFVLTRDASYVPHGTGPSGDNIPTPVVNQPPVVDAGANTVITLGEGYTLNGQVSDDGLPSGSTSSSWTAMSGPGTATFSSPGSLQSSVRFSAAGSYQLQLTASDGALSAEDTMQIVVNAPEEPDSDPDNGDAGNDRYIAIEAEDYDSITGTDTHNWVSSVLPDSSAGGAMITTPNIGVLRRGSANSPMLSYLVHFSETGKHYLWIRGWGDTNASGEGKNDSLHAGLNGVLANSADKIDYFPAGWNWSRSTRDSAVATLDIPSVGLHVVNLWMREDGLAIDKLIISPDPAYTPDTDPYANAGNGDNNGDTGNTNNAPVASAGPDQIIQLGAVVSLSGTVSDDGLPNATVTTNWQKLSGNGTVTFGDASLTSTTATFSSAGYYELRLSGSDGERSGSDVIGIRVQDPASPAAQIDANTSWNLVQTANGSRVTARHEAGAVAVNGKLYVMGGRGNRPVESYDPATRRWTSHGKAPIDIHHFQPVAVNNRIYAVGAMSGGGYPQEQSVDSVYIFNVTTHKWTKGRSIPSDRRRGSAGVAVHNNKIYIIGGNRLGHDGPSVNWFDEFDPATNQWKTLPNAPRARDHATVAVANGKLIVAAGRRTAHPNVWGDTEAATDVYDFSTGKWTSADNIPTRRAGTMTVAVGSEVVVIGGETLGSAAAHRKVESLNVNTGRWRTLQPLGVGRHSGGAAVLNNRIHVVSGNTTRGGGNETTSHETLDLPAR